MMKKQIIQTVKYFSFFSYSPSFDQIYRFLPKKTTKKKLKTSLLLLIKKNKLLVFNRCVSNQPCYTLPQYSNLFKKRALRKEFSKKKERKVRLYLRLLSFFPQIKFVGFSGSLAMNNAKKNDDIDLFIITAFNRLWTGRLLAVLLAAALFLKRKRKVKKAVDKVCLNLFFDQKNLQIPKVKRSQYVAREVLQLRPIINKDKTYERFLKANQWVYKFFPNGKNLKLNSRDLKTEFKTKRRIGNFISDRVETVLKNLQLSLIKRHQTTEMITSTQLWFHPDDFERKL